MKLLLPFLLFLTSVLPATAELSNFSPDQPPDNAFREGLTLADWEQIRSEYERHRHAMFPENGGYKARSFEQQWLAHFDAQGVLVEPDEGTWRWGLQLDGVSDARIHTEVNRIAYRWDENISEWFVNDTRGLEHGFTLAAPSQIRLRVRGGLIPREIGTEIEFADDAGEVRVRYSGILAWDVDGQSLPARMYVDSGDFVRLEVDDNGARYPITIDPLAQQSYLKASNSERGDWFGFSVAVSGNTVVVGAPSEDSGATSVNGDQSSNTQLDSGAAYVFVRSADTWVQQAYLKSSRARRSSEFGGIVAISGDTIVVGSTFGYGSAAFVFVRNAEAWSQIGILDIGPSSIAIDGDTIVAGVPDESSSTTGVNGDETRSGAPGSGAAYVYVRDGVFWRRTFLKASNTRAQEHFGWSVAVSGDTVVVGTPFEYSAATGVNGNQSDESAPDAGAVYVFVRSGETWSQQAYLKASNTESGDRFGWAVDVDGDTVVVGAEWEASSTTGINGNQSNNGAVESGAAYIFSRSGVSWTQEAYLKASNTGFEDEFGWDVAVSGNLVVVGAHGESSSGSGIDGDQSNNNALLSGAVYVFAKDGNSWLQKAYLKAPNPGVFDRFSAVDVEGDLLVIGAYREESNAKGVNGNQLDNSAADAGAVYTFTGLGEFIPPPRLEAGSAANGATFLPGLVPGSWAQVKGTDLAATTRIWQESDFSDGNGLPTLLDGVQVRVNGLPAAVYYISPTQISFQVPTGVSGTVTVQVIRDGVESATITAQAVESAPGLFGYVAGLQTYPAAVYAGTTIVVGDPAVAGNAVRQALPGDRVSLYATGIAPSPAGVLVGVSGVSGVTATIGTTPAIVEFAGLVAVGQFQINIVVPDLPPGKYLLTIHYHGQDSQEGVLFPVGP